MSVEMTILILLVLGMAFMALEAITPAFGLLGLGGAASFIGAVFMMRGLDSFMGMEVDAPLLAALGIVGAITLAASLYFVRMAWRLRATAGAETMWGMTASVLEWEGTRGRVHLDGEDWAAEGPEGLKAGDRVTVAARTNLVLNVTKG